MADYRYELDPTGRRTGVQELHNGRSTGYSYDELYRLVGETVTDPVNGGYSAEYQYDKVGNRTYSIVDGVHTAYSSDANDRLTQQGGVSYSYDANGNTLTETEDGRVTRYSYDARNKLVETTRPGYSASYGYNADGIRTRRTENGATTQFVVDSNRDYAQALAEVSNGITEVSYTYGDDLLAQQRSGATSYYLYDGHGSTRALTDEGSTVTDTYHYDAFGVLLASTGDTDNDYLYTGEQRDAGLEQYYLRARYYDQGAGRFTQMDTWMGHNSDPVTLHKYLYANADPTTFTDPSGHFGLAGTIHTISVMGSLATAATVGYEFGSIIDRTLRTGQVLSAENAKSAATIALSIIPVKYLTKIADLSAVAAKLERAGFASVIFDRNGSVKGFNKVLHWVQRLHERGFNVNEALQAVRQGATWIDTKSGAIVKVLGDARINGTIKVLIVDGKITTVLSDKLGKKFVPFSPLDL